ncbi:MAG: phosphoesterase, partial [Bdellovibrionales bacterium]|nr:phosphoesterase [Bdellovibrionales bacterium]
DPVPEPDPVIEPDPVVITPTGQGVFFNAFSDMNINTRGDYSSHTINVVQQMVNSAPDLIIGVGDYIDGEKRKLSDSSYRRMWNSFFSRVLGPITESGIPFLPSPGNHDAYYQQEQKIYQEQWEPRRPVIDFVDATHYPFYYSFMKGGVFFVSLDDARYSSLKNHGVQIDWLKQQLGSVKAQKAVAKVVYGHIPLYSVVSKSRNSNTIYHNGALKNERRSRRGDDSLEAVLIDHQVDLVIFGHSHAFFSGHYRYSDGSELKVLSLPCSGGTRRYLLGTDIKTNYGYLEVSISAQGEIDHRYLNSRGEEESNAHFPNRLAIDPAHDVYYDR